MKKDRKDQRVGDIDSRIAGLGKKDRKESRLEMKEPNKAQDINKQSEIDVENNTKEHCSGIKIKDDLAFDCD